jgi:hypothetical protein
VVSALAAIWRWRSNAEGERAMLLCAVAVGCLASLVAGLAHGLVDSGYFLVDLSWCLALVAGLTESMRNQGLGPKTRFPE